MNAQSNQNTEAEERRILAEFHYRQDREALKERLRRSRPFGHPALFLLAFLFIGSLFAYVLWNGKFALLAVLTGSCLFLTVLAMFASLCDDMHAIKEILKKDHDDELA